MLIGIFVEAERTTVTTNSTDGTAVAAALSTTEAKLDAKGMLLYVIKRVAIEWCLHKSCVRGQAIPISRYTDSSCLHNEERTDGHDGICLRRPQAS